MTELEAKGHLETTKVAEGQFWAANENTEKTRKAWNVCGWMIEGNELLPFVRQNWDTGLVEFVPKEW